MKQKRIITGLFVVFLTLVIVMWGFFTGSQPDSFSQTPYPSQIENDSSASVELIKATRPALPPLDKESVALTKMKGAKSIPQNEQHSFWSAFSEARREIRPLTDHQKTIPGNEGALYLATHPEQQIRARFLAKGARLLSSQTGRDWNVELSLSSASELLDVRQKGTQIEYVRDGLLEWYHNKTEGLEHGYIVERKTDELTANGQLRIQLRVEGLDVASVENGDLQFINEAGDPVLSYSKLQVWDARGSLLEASMEPTENGLEILVADAGASYPIMIDPLITSLETKLSPDVTGNGANGDYFGWSVSVSGDTALIGCHHDDDRGRYSGCAYVFVRNGTNWSQQARLTGKSVREGDQFGTSVSISGDTAVIGATFDDKKELNAGCAYVFVRDGTSWNQQAKLIADDGTSSDWFGTSVSVSGNTILVGSEKAADDGDGRGRAYVFVRNGTTWSQQTRLASGDSVGSGGFGFSVSISGDTALVGARADDQYGSISGSAYLFVRNDGTWSRQAKLTANDAMEGASFGKSVSVSGNTALIGAQGDQYGSAYIFVRSGVTWSQQAKLTASDPPTAYKFGNSVSLSGNTALIGAMGAQDYGYASGSAYVFVWNGTTWNQQAKIIADDGVAGAEFGISVSISDDTALIGAYQDMNHGAESGSAYVFTRNDTAWGQEAKLTSGDSAENDLFGYSVSMAGDTAIIGSYRDADNGDESGSAYVFARSGTSWSQQAKLIADDGATGDFFGWSVSVSGDTAIIGAHDDDDIGLNSGSAYVFTRSGTSWNQQAKLIPLDGAAYDNFGYSVSLSNDSALIGADSDDDNDYTSGSAYVFTRSGTVWSQQAKLIADDGARNDYFGQTVSMEGDTAIIGSYADDDNGKESGSVYIFERSGTAWSQQAKLLADDGATYDFFGRSVDLSGDTAIVGAYTDDDNGSDSGSAYVFTRSDGIWSQQAKLVPSDGAANDNFGYSVGISENIAIVGAYYDDNPDINSGSAYVFIRDDMAWGQQAKLSAADGEISDNFGCSVSLSGDTALIGAYKDDGTDLVEGTVLDQGSVYLFRLHKSGVDSDGDGASDAFELAYGFSTNNPNDLATLDTDGDRITDLYEIFHGSDKTLASSREGLLAFGPLSNSSSFVARYRHSTSGHSIIAYARWSADLEHWHSSGATWNGLRVDFSESIIESGPDYEIVQLVANLANGSTDLFYLKLDLTHIDTAP